MKKRYLLLLTIVIITITTNIQAQTTFSNALIINDQAEGPETTEPVDIDNDGDLDIIYAKTNGVGVYWIENDGFGNFIAEHTINNDINGVRTIYYSDFNNDNNMDVVCGSPSDTCLVWFENINNGTSFIKHIINNNTTNIYSVFASDINNDTYSDIVYTTNDSLFMRLGNGNGTFQTRQVISDTTIAYCLSLDDIDNDGDIDIVYSDYWNDNIGWLENSGNGVFNQNHILLSGANATCSAYITDIDGDGFKDVLGTTEFTPNEIFWFKNNGGGSFSSKIFINSNFPNIKDAFPADFDNDGDIDIIAGGYNNIYLYENDGSQNFTAHNILTNCSYVWKLRAADFDNDGDKDILAALSSKNKIVWLKNNYFHSCLIASYPFNGNPNDNSGNGYDGDITGHAPTLTTDRFGNQNSAYYFNGIDDYIALPVIDTFDVFTLSMWVNVKTFASGNTLAPFGSSYWTLGCMHWSMDGNGDNISVAINDGTTPYLISNHSFVNDITNWVNLTYVYTKNNPSILYINGILDITQTDTASVRFDSMIIGSNYNSVENDRYFNGKIDDVEIFGCALSQVQVDSLYHFNGWTTKTNCEVVNYQLNGNTDDISGNYFNGTLVNNPTLTEDRNGNQNSAYRFDTSSYMYYSTNESLGLEADLSYSAWVNIDSLTNDTNIITFVYDAIYGGTSIFAIAILEQSNELILAHDTAANSPDIIHTGYNIYPHTNYHIVVLRDDANKLYKLYMNNILINEYPYQKSFMDIPVGSRGITLSTELSTMSLNGIIDDVIIYNCLIDSTTIDSLYHVGGYTNNDNCQVVNWHLDGDSIDISGNNYHGMFFETNPEFTEDRFGNQNSAYLVDTANSFVFLSNYNLGLENSLSYSFWLNIDTLINDTSIISLIVGNDIDELSLLIWIRNDSLYFMHRDTINSFEEIGTNYLIEKNKFNHFVINRDNDSKEYTLYVNNEIEGIYPYNKNPYILPNTNQAIILGYPESDMGFNGIIDDVIVYNCIIDSNTIDSLYNIGNWQCNDFTIDTLDILDVVCGQINGIGDVVVSGGSGYYTYLWSNGDTTSNTLNLIAGMNSIIVKDSVYGCQITQYFTVNNTNAPVITISSSDNVTCNGLNNGNIFTNLSGSNYTYNWSTGSHLESITNLYAGTYSLTVIDDAGCIASETFTITEPDELSLSFNTTNSTCGNTDGTATVTAVGGTSSYSYLWSTTETTNSINSLNAGAYSVTVTDIFNCQISGSAMVSDNGAPTITLDSISNASCGIEGQVYVTIGNATSPTYEWNGNTIPNTDNLTGQSFGQNTLTVHDGTCTAMQDFYIPYTYPEKQEICIVTVDSTTGANLIVWEKEIGLQYITGYRIYRETSVPEEYVYIGQTQYDSLGVFVDNMAYPWIRSYKYKIAVIDDCDMISELSEAHKTIHVNLNVGYLQNTVNLIWDNYEGFTYTSFNILRYDVGTGWANVLGSPLPNNLHSITADVLPVTSMYAITVDKPGTACLATKTSGGPYSHSLSNLDDYSFGTITDKISNNNNIIVYPNPTNSIINIKADNIQNIEITDIRGQIISKQEINTNHYSIDMSNNAKGIYFIRISGKDYSVVKKFVLK